MARWDGPTAYEGNADSLRQGLKEVDNALAKITVYLGELFDRKVPRQVAELLRAEGESHSQATAVETRIKKNLIGAVTVLVEGSADAAVVADMVTDALNRVEELRASRSAGLPVQ